MAMGADLRLAAMIRAMAEVILPAIPKDEKLALDQGAILLGNLRMLADQEGRAWDFAMAELREQLAMIDTLAQAAEGGPRTGAATEPARAMIEALGPTAALPCPTQADLVDMARRVKEAAEVLVDAAHEDGSAGFRTAAAKAVMAQAARQIERERAWTRASDFDPAAASLDLDEILTRR